MKASALFAFCLLLLTSLSVQASWYWPFDIYGNTSTNRLSDLMVPATTNIDAAADFAAEGKYKEAQDCYRAAIAALNKIEQENPERAATPEFATVRNKRAYINAALDSMLLAEVRDNAKAVAVTDTVSLEVKIALKPWREFQPTYRALTNADALVSMRSELVEADWVRELSDSASNGWVRAACVSNRLELKKGRVGVDESRGAFQSAYKAAALAVARLERFSESARTPEGVKVFDVCKDDAHKAIRDCLKAWPKFGEALGGAERSLDGLHDALFEIAAKRDFPVILGHFLEKIEGAESEYVQDVVREKGYLAACQAMLEHLNENEAGVVHHGVLYRLYWAWGGEEPDVPTKEDDRGLVKNEGDSRPEIKSQIDTYMQKERKSIAKTKMSAERVKARKDVQREVERLLKEDPKSRRARMLMVGEHLRNGDSGAARAMVKELLDEKPNDASALNMLAAIEVAEGDLKAAEKALDRAIQSSPRDHHAYYNMARVFLQKGNVDGARRYYETGRSFGGAKDPEFEKAVRQR